MKMDFTTVTGGLLPRVLSELSVGSVSGAAAPLSPFDLSGWSTWLASLEPSFVFLLSLPVLVAAAGLLAWRHEKTTQRRAEDRDAARWAGERPELRPHRRGDPGAFGTGTDGLGRKYR
jgi:hypothetical protein